MSTSRTLIASSLIAALGGLLFGFDTAVISGAEQRLESLYNPSAGPDDFWPKFWHGTLMASALVGTVMGSIAVGRPCDWFGRRYVMFWLAMFYFASAVGSALAWDWYSLVFFRWLGGLGVGGASVVSPMYIAEISPARMRGRLVALAQFNIVMGILLAYFSNYVISSFDLDVDLEWRWMFGVEAFPALAFFFLIFFTPRSPRWLVAQGREAEAREVLEQVGVDRADGGGIDEELAAIRRSISTAHHSLQEPFFQARYTRPILLAFMIAMFNQLSGINAVLYFSRRIFENAGFAESAGLLNSVGLGFMNVVFTMLGLALIDHIGRRKLMLIGSVGYIASLSATAWVFFTPRADGTFTSIGSTTVLVSLLVFIASHAVGQGAVIWVFISEIFPNHLRARGQAFGSFTHWIFCAAISWTFPLFADQAGGYIFAFYALCMVGQLIWVLTVMPETKGVPLEEVEGE
jgi:SP family xylose:H+ symportor-like MFS transporter